MDTVQSIKAAPAARTPWNKGKLVGPKPPLQPKHVWAIRTRLQMQRKVRDLALVMPKASCRFAVLSSKNR